MADEQRASSTETRKARRQTAFYPIVSNTSNTKPFSKSAAKRDSVLALGSIEHLQHYFTKAGISARNKPSIKVKGLVPAIGSAHARNPSNLSGIPEFNFVLPPSPIVPQQNQRNPFLDYIKTYETDPDELLPGLVRDLEAVSNIWGLGTAEQRKQNPLPNPSLLRPSSSNGGKIGDFDILSALKSTTVAIRSVRNYLVALPHDLDPRNAQNFRPQTLSPRSLAEVKRSRREDDPNDPLSLIRRSALEVLSALRHIEESYRISMTDEPQDSLSDYGSGYSRSNIPSPNGRLSGDDDGESTASFAYSHVTVPGHKKTVPVWSDDEEDAFEGEGELERKERWDEKLVLGGGWLYRTDVSLTQLERERETVAQYLDCVDQALFSGNSSHNIRGWTKALDRVREEQSRQLSNTGGRQSNMKSSSNGRPKLVDLMQNMALMEEAETEDSVLSEAIDDSHLPGWAKRGDFVDNPLGRALSLLVTLLPVELLHLLPPPSENLTRSTLMFSLSSGQLLCVAYNAGVRKSKKPWGYINKIAIHDIAALEAEAKAKKLETDSEKSNKVWTFRRTENLRLWAAALKLRYLIPLVSSSQLVAPNAPSPMSSPSPATLAFHQVVPTLFDAPIIARREGNWEEMLQEVLFKWVDAVVREKRGEE